MTKSRYNRRMALLIFLLVGVSGLYVHTHLWGAERSLDSEDIYFIYLEGRLLSMGLNPYKRILDADAQDMRENIRKYPTYFPLFYLASAGTYRAGLEDFAEWLVFWRVVFLICVLSIGYMIFRICSSEGQYFLGIFGTLFWLFNRWTLHVTEISHIDFIPLLLLIVSLSLLRSRHSVPAYLLFGISLAIKQIAIFALPVYLIWTWRTRQHNRLEHVLLAFVLMVAIPLLISAPFMIGSFEGFTKSILLSATRDADSHLHVRSLDALFDVHGIAAKIPFLLLLGLTYALVLFRRVPLYASLLLVMTVFFCFHSISYRQYTVWFLAFIPLAILEI